MSKLVIFGGSFDPIHNSHLELAKQVSLFLDAKIIFVPAKNPRWKETTANHIDRLNMLKIGIKDFGFNNFDIDEFEINSDDKINFTVDTIRYFKKVYPYDELFLLIGGDEVNSFDRWKNPGEISKMCQICFVKRKNQEINKINVKNFKMRRIVTKAVDLTSSSSIRDLKCLDIQPGVLKYIEDHKLYFINKLNKYIDGKRLEHSISVANLSLEIAKCNKLNWEKAYIAGLLHDIAKKFSKVEESEQLFEKCPEAKSLPPFTYHQFLGAYLAERDFGIKDKQILNAIRYHASGKDRMSTLGKIIYAADKIDPTRGYDSSFMIKACKNSINEGFLITLKENRSFLINNNKNVENRLTDACFKYYLDK